ncbi:MAG: FkbM family methyltransferase [Acidimicrobiia bacterium]|nr:FkbM family methyltransferase [Acidimicrobiia bacterium]MDH5520664.1 FkbM family methyltransferase [Acidimicrobiia bacterium]
MNLPTVALKGRLVGTLPGRLLRRARWWAAFPQRIRHPELWDMYLEDRRVDVALRALLAADSTCVDVGAHIGSALQRLIELAPDGEHLAVEADPDKAKVLIERFPSVTVVNAAVSSSSGSARFYRARRSGFSSLRPPFDSEVAGEIDVDVISLDDLIDRATVGVERTVPTVDFIKLDVEGAELPALQGGDRLLKRDRPLVLFECGPRGSTKAFGYDRLDLYEHLRQLDYEVHSIGDFVYGRAPLSAAEFDKAGTYPYRGFNYLALPAGYKTKRLVP